MKPLHCLIGIVFAACFALAGCDDAPTDNQGGGGTQQPSTN